MTTNYGVDVLAVDDLPDPEQLGDGEENVVRALARRLLQPVDANAEIGDEDPIETMNLRDYVGESAPTVEELRAIEARAERCIEDDERVEEVEEITASYGSGQLAVAVSGIGSDGPFSFVLSVDNLTATLLIGGE